MQGADLEKAAFDGPVAPCRRQIGDGGRGEGASGAIAGDLWPRSRQGCFHSFDIG